MIETVLKIENLSKLYRLGEVGTGTISHDLNRWFAKVSGKEDPFAKVGQVNDRSKKATSDYVWALKDIGFEVKKGEVLGIIGKNGAGKSTLLKLISQITAPTTGVIKAKGRVASLLEVGTGMHPEMTAKENIYLNGAILGMTKKEIRAKFDEILDFAGCEMYVNTPIKRFSSGMTVRLAFAVAAFLDPEILIVDEVLAVGDADFQKKAIGKMKEVSEGAGRTVIFVSHNMGSVKDLCTAGILLKNGKIDFASNNIEEVIDYYLSSNVLLDRNIKDLDRKGNGKIVFTRCELLDSSGKTMKKYHTGDRMTFEFDLEQKSSGLVDAEIIIGVRRKDDSPVCFLSNNYTGVEVKISEGINSVKCVIKNMPFTEGDYIVNLMVKSQNQICDWVQDVTYFQIERASFIYENYVYPENYKGFYIEHEWTSK
jgi:lipopolysaccharide transport system ATP-binding protein